MKKILVLISFLGFVSFGSSSFGATGLNGYVVNILPELNGRVSRPGPHTVKVGDIIQIDHFFAVTPNGIPNRYEWRSEDLHVVDISPIGVRGMITDPRRIGGGQVSYFFEAKSVGRTFIKIIVDGKEYEYLITVTP